MKIIITETQFKNILKENIMDNNNVDNNNMDNNIMEFWHGGNLDDFSYEPISQKTGRYEFGPGLYMTTKYSDAVKYAKGSRKLYKITVEKGNDLDDIRINFDKIKNFLSKYVVKNKISDIMFYLEKRVDENNNVPANILNNLIVNYEAIKPANTKYLVSFFVENNIDYNIVNNAFGWHENMLILYNMRKIKNIKRIMPNDKIEKFDLH